MNDRSFVRQGAGWLPLARSVVGWYVLFALGGLTYGLMEVLARGWTHVSMLILGGVCFVLLLLMARTRLPFWAKCLAGALMITALEFATGYWVNIRMDLNVWDYTENRWNLMGQICPKFFFLWMGISAVFFFVYPRIQRLYAKMT